MAWVASKEKSIFHSHHLDLIYSQPRIFYDIILQSVRPSIDPHRPSPGPHADGVVGSIFNASVG